MTLLIEFVKNKNKKCQNLSCQLELLEAYKSQTKTVGSFLSCKLDLYPQWSRKGLHYFSA